MERHSATLVLSTQHRKHIVCERSYVSHHWPKLERPTTSSVGSVEGQGLPDVRSPDHVFLKMLTRTPIGPGIALLGSAWERKAHGHTGWCTDTVAPSLMTPQTVDTHGPTRRRTGHERPHAQRWESRCAHRSLRAWRECATGQRRRRESASYTVPSA